MALSSLRALCLVCCVCCARGYSVSGARGLSKIFPAKQGLWSSLLARPLPPGVAALRNVSAVFPPGLTALCGPSGSGKSTLSKIVLGRLPCDAGVIVAAGDDAAPRCNVYVDHLFHLSYDASKPVATYLPVPAPDGDPAWACVADVLGLPGDRAVNALLESQRKLFEVALALRRSGFDATSSALVVLDEYLDKDVPAVRDLVLDKLRALCARPPHEMRFQALVVTHSKAVAGRCDHIVVLKKGSVYNQGEAQRVVKNLPPDFIVLP